MVVAVFSQPVARLLFRPAAPDFSREAAILDSLEQLFQTTGATPPQHDRPGSSSAVRQNSNEHRKPVPKWER
ncbi:MAG TPA: hypothetical protein VKZ75_07405, partial [Cyclobacteriaceae bacterium]|nr:hypothetical protein [Cyclobacteriaceae bacterium]